MEDVVIAPSRVLVTGGYGLIGSWLVEALVDSGASVCVVRRDRPARAGLITMGLEPRVNIVEGDVCAPGLIGRALAEYEIESVFHLAAQTVVGTARRYPLSTFETNIRGTWTVLEACRQQRVERVIVASSDKAYGSQRGLPYREDAPLDPRHPYDVSKAAADLIARSYWHSWDLPVAVTRFANVYGGGDPNASRLVPEAVTAALSSRAPVLRSDGTPERDFLYVEDAVAAYLAIWEGLGRSGGGAVAGGGGAVAGEGAVASGGGAVASGGGAVASGGGAVASGGGAVAGEAFNAGGGAPYRVGEVVELICTLAETGVQPSIRGSGIPVGEIDRQWVDYSKLNAATGWRPEVDLETGLRRTIDWYRGHPEWLDEAGRERVPSS